MKAGIANEQAMASAYQKIERLFIDCWNQHDQRAQNQDDPRDSRPNMPVVKYEQQTLEEIRALRRIAGKDDRQHGEDGPQGCTRRRG